MDNCDDSLAGESALEPTSDVLADVADPGKEVASILAEALLEMLVPGAGRLGGNARNALIPGSQPALLLTEKGRKHPSKRGRKTR